MVLNPSAFVVKHFLGDQVLEIVDICFLWKAHLLIDKRCLYLPYHVGAAVHILELGYLCYVNWFIRMHQRLILDLIPHLDL